MNTKGNFKEMPKYCPFAFLHQNKQHFDVIVKVKSHDSYTITSNPGKTGETIFNIKITSKKRKYRSHELLYISKIQVPVMKPLEYIIINVVHPDMPGTDPGGTTVIRYGDTPPPPPNK